MHQQRRDIKGNATEDEILKKMAHAEAVNKGKKKDIGTLGRIHDRDFVKNVREPAKFNAMTFNKEYGGNGI